MIRVHDKVLEIYDDDGDYGDDVVDDVGVYDVNLLEEYGNAQLEDQMSKEDIGHLVFLDILEFL